MARMARPAPPQSTKVTAEPAPATVRGREGAAPQLVWLNLPPVRATTAMASTGSMALAMATPCCSVRHGEVALPHPGQSAPVGVTHTSTSPGPAVRCQGGTAGAAGSSGHAVANAVAFAAATAVAEESAGTCAGGAVAAVEGDVPGSGGAWTGTNTPPHASHSPICMTVQGMEDSGPVLPWLRLHAQPRRHAKHFATKPAAAARSLRSTAQGHGPVPHRQHMRRQRQRI